jgi:hypothetical protein
VQGRFGSLLFQQSGGPSRPSSRHEHLAGAEAGMRRESAATPFAYRGPQGRFTELSWGFATKELSRARGAERIRTAVCVPSTTPAVSVRGGEWRLDGWLVDNQCESLPPGRQRAPNWKARAPTAYAGKVVTDRRQARATSKPPTRSRSFEGEVKGNGGRTSHTAQG